MRMFEDDELPGQWSNADLATQISNGRPENDALVLRVLAARIAQVGGDNQDPLMTIKDLSRAVDSIAAAVDAIITASASGHEPQTEEAAEFTATIKHLARAADGLHTLTGWF